MHNTSPAVSAIVAKVTIRIHGMRPTVIAHAVTTEGTAVGADRRRRLRGLRGWRWK